MMSLDNTIVWLLDPDERHATLISGCIAPYVRAIELCRSLGELVSRGPSRGLIVVRDTGALVSDAQRAMSVEFRWLPHVAYGEESTAARIVDTILGGAIDYLVLPLASDTLEERMRNWGRKALVTGRYRRRVLRARTSIAGLSRRETEVLALTAEGRTIHQTARALGISPRTAEIHRANAMRKLQVNSSLKAAMIFRWATLPA